MLGSSVQTSNSLPTVNKIVNVSTTCEGATGRACQHVGHWPTHNMGQ